MNEMIERVSRALCIADGCNPDHQSNDPLDDGQLLWTTYAKDARAAIEAMREPTDEMRVALGNLAIFDPAFSTGDAWLVMIDAALA